MPTPLVLESVTLVDVDTPLSVPPLTVTALPIVAPVVPNPTLVDGRPV